MKNKKLYQKFWKNGYIIIPNFLMKKDINKIFFQLNDIIKISTKGKKNKSLDSLDKKYLYLKKNNPKLKSHFYDLTKYCDSLIDIAGSNKFLKYAKLFLNSKTVFVDTPQIRIDHTKENLSLPEHQELNQISKDVITFWIPLVNINKKTGGLHFRPKTHKLGHVKYKNSHLSAEEAGKKRLKIIENLFNKKKYKKFKLIVPKLNAGDAVIFHTFIFHGTHLNLSKNIRWTYISRYNSIKNAPYLKNKNAKLRIPYNADYNRI